jgi:hypothetical protein
MSKALTKGEVSVMNATFKATMLRAAAIVEGITDDDVLEAQRQLLGEGVAPDKVTKVDRAHIAASHLRASAEGKKAIPVENSPDTHPSITHPKEWAMFQEALRQGEAEGLWRLEDGMVIRNRTEVLA